MIIYPTKDTFARYKLPYPEKLSSPEKEKASALLEQEQGNRMLEWGCKLFFYQGKKCLQVLHFSSKFTLFFMDLKQKEIPFLQNMIEETVINMFLDDEEMREALLKLFATSQEFCFQKLTDRSAISSMNRTYMDFCGNGEYLDVYHKNDEFQVDIMNYKVNFKYIMSIKVNGKSQYEYVGEVFRQMVLNYYGK